MQKEEVRKEGDTVKDKIYAAIDLKSFYASVECVERGLDPLNTNLVVADASRCKTTICLAVSPSLKSFGVPSRPRLFEVIQKVKEANLKRQKANYGSALQGSSHEYDRLMKNPYLAIDYIVATPRMAHYLEYSAKIYEIYLRYIAAEDIHVYSIDEVFMDITGYLKNSGMNAHDFIRNIIADVLKETGITATAGIGTNLYLCKVAMDIVAKHQEPDCDGVRIAQLDEMSYRHLLWEHQPITDFWRVGGGYARRLAEHEMYTMGDIARCSLHNQPLLYKLFGVNAELLIDHAWGKESCTMADIKAYRPSNHSTSIGQVLHCPYEYEKARLIVKEMSDQLSLNLVSSQMVCDGVSLSIGYDIDNLKDDRAHFYKGDIVVDHYGRKIPKHAHGSRSLACKSSSSMLIREAMEEIFERVVDSSLLIRRINVTAHNIIPREQAKKEENIEQLNLFVDYEKSDQQKEVLQKQMEKEQNVQETLLQIQQKYGKNAVLRGMNLEEGATAKQRNEQIGGHKA